MINWRNILLIGFLPLHLFSQKEDTATVAEKRLFPKTAGLTGYYFWQEDSSGNIASSEIRLPWMQNREILLHETEPAKQITEKELTQSIQLLAQNPKWDPANSYPLYRLFHRKQRKLIHCLEMKEATQPESILYRKTPSGWKSEQAKRVIYFDIQPDHSARYAGSSDSLLLPEYGLQIPSNGLYVVYRSDSSAVYTYNGENITQELLNSQIQDPIRILLFVNGYRGPKRNDDPGDGLVTRKDRYYYWYKIDNRFQEVLQPDVSFYLDGSFPIYTSNHRTRLRFGLSWLRAKLTFRKQLTQRAYKRMNTNPNPEGFYERVRQGKLGGMAFLQARHLHPLSDTVRDTIDIVCHSMGYAYALGFLSVTAPHCVLGKMYIMAPENAGVQGYDWSTFEEVWQYGSDLDQPGADPLQDQDGIAPQSAVKGLDKMPADHGGRVFFPTDWPGKNFVDSHMVYSYDWMFDCIPEGEAGFIHK